MADETKRTDSSSKPLFASPVAMVVLGLVLCAAAAVASILGELTYDRIQFENTDQYDALTRLWVTYLIYSPAVALGLLGLTTLVIGAVRWGVYGRDSRGVPAPPDNRELADLLRSINQRLLLSETAKRIAYRQQDLAALRRTIEQDIEQGNFDAAMVLVSELAQNYGYREEAEGYRDRITVARTAEQERKIDEALAQLNQLLGRHDYERAAREAAKIQRLFPDSERVRDLTRKVVQAREAYKQQLEREFLEASQRDDVDRALELMKILDKYLTEAEAAPLRETAKGVIGKKRDNLGVQFKMAVHDREWTQAVRVGEQIIREFPNTRMAEEVRGMIDVLRERAAGQQAARGQQPAGT